MRSTMRRIVIGMCTALLPFAQSACAQLLDAVPKPAVIDPAWFSGHVPATTSGKAQPSCISDDHKPCIGRFDPQPKPATPRNTVSLDVSQGLIRKHATSSYYNKDLADGYLTNHEFGPALQQLNAVIRKWYSDSEALWMRSEVYRLLGRDDLALEDIGAAIFWSEQGKVWHQDSKITNYYNRKAQLLERLGRADEAKLAYQGALSWGTGDAAASDALKRLASGLDADRALYVRKHMLERDCIPDLSTWEADAARIEPEAEKIQSAKFAIMRSCKQADQVIAALGPRLMPVMAKPETIGPWHIQELKTLALAYADKPD